MIFGLGIFYGGMAQFVAGLYELKKGNTTFFSFGASWLSFCSMVIDSPFLGVSLPNHKAEGIYLFFWVIFT